MADVYIDMEVLDRVRRNIQNISALMTKPAREMEAVDGKSMGVPELARRMDDFGDEWSYGVKQLAKFSDAAADALAQVKKGFKELDGKLADELANAAAGGGK
ncbi:hypothetical protein O7599_19195 [Streptomyces sp. WMMC500]|uniref:hypothetical protein n=1 Tax=Streptomyces sp. WMMC500 TaxID=3015154 RepID=UPI00248B16BE|nr:hypothetical protein [Streptomyces sp. WMMC500]WBB57808.1 hypothetical protein O7599_19195 [Streptomyces sp. WMMC500]